MQQLANDTFKQFIPLELIKGTDKDGKEIVKFKSLVSTTSEDADGEWLDPSGFNYSKLMSNGVINWNHQGNNSPKASFLGKPTNAYSDDEGGWVEGELYSNLPMVQEVLELQKGLKEYNMTLGVSIEGQATERDKGNPLKVLKANITGLAITPTPKNIDTTFELIKGMGLNQLIKNKEGDEEDTEKAMTASGESGQALTKESLEDDLKDISGADKIDVKEKKISKGEALEKLSLSLPNRKAVEVLSIYNKLENLDKMDINLETIEKALDLLKLKVGDETVEVEDVIEKGVVSDEDLLSQRDAAKLAFDKLNKACDDKGLIKGDDTPEEEEVDEEKEGGKKKKKDAMEKSISGNELIKGIVSSAVSKALDESKEILIKGVSDEFAESFLAVGKLQKGVIDQLTIQNELLNKIAHAPNTPKSIIGLGSIEKGFDTGDLNDLKKVSKREAINIIDAVLEKGNYADQALTQSMRVYEAANELQPIFMNALVKEGVTL